jgi:hypothetical protein
MYRVSVTTIEKFRRFMVGLTSFDTEEALLECIKGVFKGTPKTSFGGAYHIIIEGQSKPCVLTKSQYAGDYVFTEKQAAPALEYRKAHPSMVHEMNVRKVYETTYMPIQVTGRVDAVEGLSVRDAKCKFRAPDWEEYIDSCQWKFYLDMLDAEIFCYDVFEIKGFKEDDYCKNHLFPDVQVLGPETLECIRFAGMEHQLTNLLNLFMGYVVNRDLFQYLKPAIDANKLPFD